jgi:hypothetical protein
MDRMLRRIGTAALWLFAFFLVLIAVNSNEPYLAKLRGIGHVMLVMVAIGVPATMVYCGAWCLARRPRETAFARRLMRTGRRLHRDAVRVRDPQI